MSSVSQTSTTSKGALWSGRVLSLLLGAALLLASVMNLTKNEQAVKGTKDMGYSESVMVPLGVITIVSVILYWIPTTSVLGAILLTGYLGGAVATHVIHKDPTFKICIPVVFGALLWLALVLRDARVRSVLPVRI